jgi:hypothetical protein
MCRANVKTTSLGHIYPKGKKKSREKGILTSPPLAGVGGKALKKQQPSTH